MKRYSNSTYKSKFALFHNVCGEAMHSPEELHSNWHTFLNSLIEPVHGKTHPINEAQKLVNQLAEQMSEHKFIAQRSNSITADPSAPTPMDSRSILDAAEADHTDISATIQTGKKEENKTEIDNSEEISGSPLLLSIIKNQVREDLSISEDKDIVSMFSDDKYNVYFAMLFMTILLKPRTPSSQAFSLEQRLKSIKLFYTLIQGTNQSLKTFPITESASEASLFIKKFCIDLLMESPIESRHEIPEILLSIPTLKEYKFENQENKVGSAVFSLLYDEFKERKPDGCMGYGSKSIPFFLQGKIRIFLNKSSACEQKFSPMDYFMFDCDTESSGKVNPFHYTMHSTTHSGCLRSFLHHTGLVTVNKKERKVHDFNTGIALETYASRKYCQRKTPLIQSKWATYEGALHHAFYHGKRDDEVNIKFDKCIEAMKMMRSPVVDALEELKDFAEKDRPPEETTIAKHRENYAKFKKLSDKLNYQQLPGFVSQTIERARIAIKNAINFFEEMGVRAQKFKYKLAPYRAYAKIDELKPAFQRYSATLSVEEADKNTSISELEQISREFLLDETRKSQHKIIASAIAEIIGIDFTPPAFVKKALKQQMNLKPK